MRILLVSDTHGHLHRIGELARVTGAEAVIHAGDFGFYDGESADRLAPRELWLHVAHSDLSYEDKQWIRTMGEEDLRAFVRDHLPLSEFPAHISGDVRFPAPVFAVWGNHEDKVVVESLRRGEIRVENLTLLDGRGAHEVGPLTLFGLGGNVLSGKKLLHRPIGGGSGKIWVTLEEVGELLETADGLSSAGCRVLVTHVSPGKQPLVGRLAAHVGARLTVSGHMGSPFTNVWSEFTIRETPASIDWLNSVPAGVLETLEAGVMEAREPRKSRLERGLRALRELPGTTAGEGGRCEEPAWMRGVSHVNLPDAPDGHAVLEVGSGRLKLETASLGIRI